MKLFEFKHYKVIKKNIGDITNETLIHFMTFGRWHSYELLLYVLSYIGVCNMTITTFGLSEEAIRTLQKIKDAGLIKNLTVIINLSSRRYKKSLLIFLNKVADNVLLQNVHAKLFFIEGRTMNAVVNQSANFSTNPTNEVGVISTRKEDINQYKEFLKQTKSLSKRLDLSNKWDMI